MKKQLTLKNIGLAFAASMLLFIVVKAATGYDITVTQLNDSEFPRVQVAMNISGKVDFLPRNIEIEEGGKANNGPLILLPPHKAPSKINLHILVDTSARTSGQADLIRSNLEAMVQHLFELDMAEGVYLSTFNGSQNDLFSNSLQGVINNLNALTFSGEITQKINGFAKISEKVSASNPSGNQKVLLIVNGSDFEDNGIEGVLGSMYSTAISKVDGSDNLAFVLGHPLRKIHAVRADDEKAPLEDLSHRLKGGYLGGFGADLTSLVDLLKMQSENDYVMQYYSIQSPGSFVGSQATIRIDGSSTQNITYKNSPVPASVSFDHLPENELIVGEVPPIEVDVAHHGNMVNAVELKYKNEAGDLKAIPLTHKRSDDVEGANKYFVDIPTDALWKDPITYYISAETPYKSIAEHGFTLPVNSYNGIELTAQDSFDGSGKIIEIIWTWTVPADMKAKEYEVWLGDDYQETTDLKEASIPIGADGKECDRYQVVQIKVTMPDGTISKSKPVSHFADADDDGPMTEWNGLSLMDNCLEEKKTSITKIRANTFGFDPVAKLTLERAGLYLAKFVSEGVWDWQEITSEGIIKEKSFPMIHYIMRFINREEYLQYGIGGGPIKESLVYKLIGEANHTDNINEAYANALKELSKRITGALSL